MTCCLVSGINLLLGKLVADRFNVSDHCIDFLVSLFDELLAVNNSLLYKVGGILANLLLLLTVLKDLSVHQLNRCLDSLHVHLIAIDLSFVILDQSGELLLQRESHSLAFVLEFLDCLLKLVLCFRLSLLSLIKGGDRALKFADDELHLL